MNDLVRIFLLLWRGERRAFLRGLALSVAVLIGGLALLGLSGWFIVAAGIAGLAGTGAAFDVFRPSAGVRFLALGRTAARYGERVLTHDATLGVLARLRAVLLRGFAEHPFATLVRLRASATMNRILTDVDALDGLAIRLVFPVGAGLASLLLAAAVLAGLTDLRLALWILLATLIPAGGVFVHLARQSLVPSTELAALVRRLRAQSIDHLRGRTLLTFAGALARSRNEILADSKRAGAAAHRLARLEFRSAALLTIVVTVVAAGTLAIAAVLVTAGGLSGAAASLAFFVVLASAEVLAPLQRGLSEIGKMRDAAGRVAPLMSVARDAGPASIGLSCPSAPVLAVDALVARVPNGRRVIGALSLTVDAGESVAIVGPSGSGKTTVLNTVAGLIAPQSGRVRLNGWDLRSLPEATLRAQIGFLQQRSSLIGGSVAETLRLAQPEAADNDLWRVLKTVALADLVARRGGLGAKLAETGGNLSGGEARRMALARVLIRRPRLLLLDEPTEGLDDRTARDVLDAIRGLLPDSAILFAAHKEIETGRAVRVVSVKTIDQIDDISKTQDLHA